MRNRLTAAAAAGFILLVLVACGSAVATQAPQPTEAQPTEAPPATQAPPATEAPPATTAPTAAATPAGAADCSSDATGDEEVEIANFEYEPRELTVAAGTTVAWTNSDAVAHTVTFEGGPDCGSLGQGESTAREFTTAGTYDYVCTFHPNMRATVTVE